jgi:hypothetical protein
VPSEFKELSICEDRLIADKKKGGTYWNGSSEGWNGSSAVINCGNITDSTGRQERHSILTGKWQNRKTGKCWGARKMSQRCTLTGYLFAQIHYFVGFFEQINNLINKFQRGLMFGGMARPGLGVER